ncbi:hypothetical protein ILUMI_09604 [Ignelater luminosus]|uniref:SWIM-type domain-containing protein n=1 Tax=Ignelater luminosus TaxID=2038154 RepID=A0A8K0D207_IGNLU|nr:hypothetical protein ILUMI_09604 [Ignelater luminosus]
MESGSQIIPTLALNLLTDAEAHYKQDNKFSPEILQSLHAVFGNVLIRAAEMLENASFLRYQTHNKKRQLIKVVNRSEQYTLFTNINFCHCQAFKYQVLQTRNVITCKHVLAAKLAHICGQMKVELVTDNQLADLLNYQYEQHGNLQT